MALVCEDTRMFKAKRNKITKQNGFTLVELLVVIAIIALLLSVLMPSLQKARNLAKTAICGSRSRQVSLALMAYAQSYDGFIMPTTLQYEKDGVTEVPYYHSNAKDADGKLLWRPEVEYWYLNLYAHKYLPVQDAFFCPDFFPQNYKQHKEYEADREAKGLPYTNFDKGEAFTLGMRDWSYANSTCYRSPKLLTKLPQPSDFFLVADSIDKNYKTINIVSTVSGPSQFYRIVVRERAYKVDEGKGPKEIGVHARHNNKASTLFADGHVEREKIKFFLDICGPRDWQYPYSRPWASTTYSGYRVFDKRNDEWDYMGVGSYRNARTREYSSDP